MSAPNVRTGLDALVAESFASLAGARVAVLANPSSVDGQMRHIIDLLIDAPNVELVAILAPEHGVHAEVQDQVEKKNEGEVRGVPVISIYGDSFTSLWPATDVFYNVDVLLIDIQDIGSRYYTFYTSAAFCIERAIGMGVRTVVLDRPNPLGGIETEGPMLKRSMRSFVGYFPLPARHGMTLGELLRHILDINGWDMDLEIVPMQGWRRDMPFEETGLQWVMPSPNMPTLQTARVYPGACLMEGTTLSEGRGTTKPFELIGAPYVKSKGLVEALNGEKLPGASFRQALFLPMFGKHKGVPCEGLQVHVTNPRTFKPWLTCVAILKIVNRLYRQFDWYRGVYEFVSDRLAIDLLLGDSDLRWMIEQDADLNDFDTFDAEARAEYDEARRKVALYPYE